MGGRTVTDNIATLRSRRGIWFEKIRRWFDLVSFSDLADCLARVPGRLGRDDHQRVAGLTDLRDAVLSGAFGAREKLGVVYLPPPHGEHPGRLPLRLTQWQVRNLTNGWGVEHAAHLWAPRAVAKRWFETRGFSYPEWLEPSASPPLPKWFWSRNEAKTSGGASLSSIETACQKWLSGLMRDNPNGDPEHRSKAAFKALAMDRYKALGHRQFARAWDNAVIENAGASQAWTKAGAKPKLRQ